MSAETREGGCLCGLVRYRVTWPPQALVTCSCTNCQKQSGSALSVVGVARRNDLALTGTLTTFEDKGDSGKPVYRQFCARCGSPGAGHHLLQGRNARPDRRSRAADAYVDQERASLGELPGASHRDGPAMKII
jgi:hypothetical protein